jgi:hypothetical protein
MYVAIGDANYCGSSGCRFVLNEKYDQPTTAPGWTAPTPGIPASTVDEVFIGSASGCVVKQVSGLPPEEAKIRIDAAMNDDEAALTEVKVLIGTHRMANDVGETSFGVADGLSEVYLPPIEEVHRHGVPLFFTVSSTNSAGKTASLQCLLHSFDTSPPEVVVTSPVVVQSHMEQLTVDYFISDDTGLTRVQYGLALSLNAAAASDVLAWRDLELSSSWEAGAVRHGPLDWFLYEREWLTGKEADTKRQGVSLEQCAQACLELLTGSGCRAFQHENAKKECLLYEEVPSASTYRRAVHEGERYHLRKAEDKASHIEQGTLIINDLTLEGGKKYYVVFRARNELGYETIASHEGTLIDVSAPTSALIVDPVSEALLHEMCGAAPSQRCYNMYNASTNHMIVDGPGSVAVLNGLSLGIDQKFPSNVRIGGCQFDGLIDEESGLYKVFFAIGTSPCATDVTEYDDPHEHLIS